MIRTAQLGRRAAMAAVCAALVIADPAGAQAPAPVDAHLVTPIDEEPRIDVGLGWDLDSVKVRAVGGIRIYRSGDQGDQQVGETRTSVEIRRAGPEWEIVWDDAAGDAQSDELPPLDTLWIADTDQDPVAHRLKWNGKTWRGLGKVFVGPRGKLTLALRLPLETYLLGVIPGEIGALSQALLEAGRAQAIAARSYTLFYLGRRGAEGFDLFGTVEDQVYGGVESERPLATECVVSTGGRIALYDGRPIRANYCSTCGGITAEVWEAWPTVPLGYLRSLPDMDSDSSYCTTSRHYRWREEWTAGEFVANIQRFAPVQGIAMPEGGLGDLIDVLGERRSRSGRVWRLIVRGSNGDVAIPSYSIRQVLRRGGDPNSILRSNLFKIGVRRDPGTRRALEVVVSGAGSGHGVGLCQTGALGMARAGKSAEQIMAHYYPGIDIKQPYAPASLTPSR